MNACFFVNVLLHLSLATAVNFTQVYGRPSEASRTQALEDRTFEPENVKPLYNSLLITVPRRKSTRAIQTIATVSQTKPTPVTSTTSTERSSLSIPTTTTFLTLAEKTATTEVPESSTLTEKLFQNRLFIIILICFIVFSVILFGLIIICIWLLLRKKRINSLPPNTNEAQELSVIADDGPEEVLYEEVKHDQAAPPAAPSLYERPIILSPRSARRVKAMPARQRTFEKFGEAPRAPVESDDDGPALPDPSTRPRCEDNDTSESAQ